MKVAILGTRGIPNHYGGFEQCAEYLALGLVRKGFEVLVYNSHNHPYQEDTWKGVQIIHCYDPEFKWGTAGQFVYDLNCIKDVRKRNCDVILQLGYTSNTVWGWMLPRKNTVITTNMDGLEWKRTKYSKKVQKFLQYAESLGVKYSDYLISDSIGIQNYLKNKYGKDSVYIPYGADLFTQPVKSDLSEYGVKSYKYDILIARMEPENNIETILDGVVLANSNRDFIVIGKHDTPYGTYIKKRYANHPKIQFLGSIYNMADLNSLRYYANLYFHGHSVGGTNPSLLEAMASDSLICAHENQFNRYILEDDAYYFSNPEEVAACVKEVSYFDEVNQKKIENNKQKIVNKYSWQAVIDAYAAHFLAICEKKDEYAIAESSHELVNKLL